MFKKFSEKFPAAAAKGTAYIESLTKLHEDANSKPAEETTSISRTSDEEETAENASTEAGLSTATLAASSVMGFMRKAQSVASVAVKEGSSKAINWKNKAMDIADMDALQRRLNNALDRPMDDVNLNLLNFTYITDSIIAMGFPSMNLGTNRTYLHDNPIDLVSTYFNRTHSQHYMIWNLSEESYDYAYFDNQVLEFKFPGHPAPPLGLVFKLCASIENWLTADINNVAAIHCLTGKGRTGTIIACYLTWIGMFETATEALEFVCSKRSISVEKMTIPSQRRYLQYFSNIMEGLKPNALPQLLRRVIINKIPIFASRKRLECAKTRTSHEGEYSNSNDELVEATDDGCCPFLQIFRSGKLIFTTAWNEEESEKGVPWVNQTDGSAAFSIDCMLQGDILLRCRHLTENGSQISMFRAAFHTGYITDGVLRLTKNQLDGACCNDQFDQDFFVDLLFGEVQAGFSESTDGNTTSKPCCKKNQANETISRERTKDPSASPRSEGISILGQDRQVYEHMLHRDEAFWQDIEARKARLQAKREADRKRQNEEKDSSKEIPTKYTELSEQSKPGTSDTLPSQTDDYGSCKESKALPTSPADEEEKASTDCKFSITSGEDEDRSKPLPARDPNGSWNEENDIELMSALESITQDNTHLGEGANNAVEDKMDTSMNVPSEQSTKDPHSTQHHAMDELSKELEEIRDLERELGLNTPASDEVSTSRGNTSTDLQDLGLDLPPDLMGSANEPDELNALEDDSAFAVDDFDELEQYLSSLTSSMDK
uniref:Phosphatidylinositol3 putative n=1 Tax=Albugo laibachii Nc14 TaxID=890382 RepID=F0WXX2_9STRA|nr:phosphatidylinositol3 putative [Albugo laibachii Nc14]|eukprot:CCA26320.1 phosphatidylinositol3 putative [Albugo laibachii Nc14]